MWWVVGRIIEEVYSKKLFGLFERHHGTIDREIEFEVSSRAGWILKYPAVSNFSLSVFKVLLHIVSEMLKKRFTYNWKTPQTNQCNGRKSLFVLKTKTILSNYQITLSPKIIKSLRIELPWGVKGCGALFRILVIFHTFSQFLLQPLLRYWRVDCW